VESEVRTASFALPLPDGWEDRTVVTIAGPDDQGFAPNIVVTRERLCDHMGLGAFSQGWLARLRDEVPVAETESVEHTEIAGVPAQIRRVSWQAAGLRLEQLAALFVIGDDGWGIVATATDWRFAELEPLFRRIMHGFRLASPVAT
jgi:hypothetical protein